ncbi:hypothetical protein Tco_1218641 [Tanacetum coccineum]
MIGSMEIDAEPVHFGQDGLGDFDWSNKADDTPVSLALMATNSEDLGLNLVVVRKVTIHLGIQIRLNLYELAIRNKVVNQENTKSSQPEIDRNKVIIEDWVDSDDEETALNFSEIQKKTILNSENSETSFENRRMSFSIFDRIRSGLSTLGRGGAVYISTSPIHREIRRRKEEGINHLKEDQDMCFRKKERRENNRSEKIRGKRRWWKVRGECGSEKIFKMRKHDVHLIAKVEEEESVKRMVIMKKIDDLNNENDENKWQSMVLEIKI